MSSSKPALPHNRTIRCKAAKEALPTDAHSTVTTCYSNPVSRIARDLQQRRNGMHRKTRHQLLECWRTCQDRVFCGDTPCVCKMVQTHDAFRPASLCCSGIVNLLPGLQRAPHQRGYVVARPSQSAASPASDAAAAAAPPSLSVGAVAGCAGPNAAHEL